MSHVSFPNLGIEFDINRVAFTIGQFDVFWYGILIASGMLLGILYGTKICSRFGIKEDDLLDIVIIGAVIAVISGRSFYVVFNPDFTVHNIKEFFNLRGGGTAFYGVLIGALISAFLVCKIKRIPVLPVLDCVAPGLLIGQGIGRWGNFFNQELFGTNTDLPWAMYSDTISRYVASNAAHLKSAHGIIIEDAPVHPTFLYESIWCLIGFLLIRQVIKKRRFDGEVMLKYLVWNGIGRGFTEQLRTDALFLGRVRISQFVCICLAVASLIILISVYSSIRRLNDPDFLKTYYLRLQESEKQETQDTEEITSEEVDESNDSDSKQVIDEEPEESETSEE